MLNKGAINEEQVEGLIRKVAVKDTFLLVITIAPGMIHIQIWLYKLLVNSNISWSK